jgi:hypothetical protein
MVAPASTPAITPTRPAAAPLRTRTRVPIRAEGRVLPMAMIFVHYLFSSSSVPGSRVRFISAAQRACRSRSFTHSHIGGATGPIKRVCGPPQASQPLWHRSSLSQMPCGRRLHHHCPAARRTDQIDPKGYPRFQKEAGVGWEVSDAGGGTYMTQLLACWPRDPSGSHGQGRTIVFPAINRSNNSDLWLYCH